MPREARKSRTPSQAGLAVDVLVVVVVLVEGHEGLAGAAGPLPQEPVEHLLPGGGVNLGRLGQHAVEIEQARRMPSGSPSIVDPASRQMAV